MAHTEIKMGILKSNIVIHLPNCVHQYWGCDDFCIVDFVGKCIVVCFGFAISDEF